MLTGHRCCFYANHSMSYLLLSFVATYGPKLRSSQEMLRQCYYTWKSQRITQLCCSWNITRALTSFSVLSRLVFSQVFCEKTKDGPRTQKMTNTSMTDFCASGCETSNLGDIFLKLVWFTVYHLGSLCLLLASACLENKQDRVNNQQDDDLIHNAMHLRFIAKINNFPD